jgi:hypothetical protein
VAATVAEENSCGTLKTRREPMLVQDVGQAPQRFEEATSKGTCTVSVEVTLDSTRDATLDRNAVCVIVLEPGVPGPGEEDGVVFNVYAEGPPSCRHLQIASSAMLAPPMNALPGGGGGRSVPASAFNPWQYREIRGKIIGTDCCTFDMFWEEIRMGWWFDGYYAGWMTWVENSDGDPWWDRSGAATVTYVRQYNYTNYVSVEAPRSFHSDGFPLGHISWDILSPSVDAGTTVLIKGYYNGTGGCWFPRRSYYYDAFAWLYYGAGTALRWKNNVCVWSVP